MKNFIFNVLSGIFIGLTFVNFVIIVEQSHDITNLQREVKKIKNNTSGKKSAVMNDVGRMMQRENDMSNDYSIQDDTLTIVMSDDGPDSTGQSKHTINDTFIIPSEAISKATKYNFNIEFYFKDSKGDKHLLYSDYYNHVIFIAKNTFVR